METDIDIQSIQRAVDEYASVRSRARDLQELQRIRLNMLSAASGIDLDPNDIDPTTKSWMEYLADKETRSYPTFDTKGVADELYFYVKRMQEWHPRQQRNREIREDIESDRTSLDKDADGLPSGTYEVIGDEFKRVGDVEELTRYHGTVVPEGAIIEKFKPSFGNTDSINRPSIGNAAAIYSTPNAEAALEYAMGYNNAHIDPDQQGQLYTLRINPDEVVDLGHCQDDASARLAIKKGFDVIECPDFWEQPETITFDPDKIDVSAVYPVTDASVTEDFEDHKWTPEGDKVVDELKAQGFLNDSIYKEDRRIGQVQDAVAEYKDANDVPTTSTYEPGGIMERYSSMFPKAPSHAPKRGRGQVGR